MLTFTISAREEGRKLGRYLKIQLPGAPASFWYKAIRRNKVKIDKKKPADLNQTLTAGQTLVLYLTQEQEEEFTKGRQLSQRQQRRRELTDRVRVYPDPQILYEDQNLLIVNKPAGVLTQKSKASDISMTEICRHYLDEKKNADGKNILAGKNDRAGNNKAAASFQPSFCHRLDRNTGGVLIMAKTLKASQAVSAMLTNRTIRKTYEALVEGCPDRWTKPTTLIHAYQKDSTVNKAVLGSWDQWKNGTDPNVKKAECRVQLVRAFDDFSLVEVELMTGRSHQIRAQLAYEGYPIVGDGKYNPGAKGYHQMLRAASVTFGKCPAVLSYMEGKTITAPRPLMMQTMISKGHM